MAEMVGSAVAQEVVSGAFSFMRNSHEEMAAQSHLIERLKWAHWKLERALERTKGMPIIEVPLLQQRMMVKHVFEESRDLLHKLRTPRVNLEDKGAEKGVTFSPSLPSRIMHTVKTFFGTEKGSIRESRVRRFELFAEKADEFRRDLESGFSLAPYRFSSPVITQLLEGKFVYYKMVSGSQTHWLSIIPCFLEDYGVVALLTFEFKDLEAPTPMNCFSLVLFLRLSESTDIVGICTKCLQSIELLKSVADVAKGELAQISTQVSVLQPGPAHREHLFNLMTDVSRLYRQEPLCCIDDGFQPSDMNMPSSKLTERFPEQVSFLQFECFISWDNLLSPTLETNRNNKNLSPILLLSFFFAPHYIRKAGDGIELLEPFGCSDISSMLKVVQLLAVNATKLDPDNMEQRMVLSSAHGHARFTVSKPTTEMRCARKIGDGSKTRRASKRKR